MEHLTEIQLLDSCRGIGDAAVKEHLDGCEECTERLGQLVSSWEILGKWQVDSGGRDVVAKVMAAAERDNRLSVVRSFSVSSLTWLRAAAVIGVAVVLGHALGRRDVGRGDLAGHIPVPETSYVSALAMDFSSDLTLLAVEDHIADRGAGHE